MTSHSDIDVACHVLDRILAMSRAKIRDEAVARLSEMRAQISWARDLAEVLVEWSGDAQLDMMLREIVELDEIFEEHEVAVRSLKPALRLVR